MTLQSGMDIAEIRQIATRLEGTANQIAATETAIGALMGQARQNWFGPDLARFDDGWQSRHRPELRRLSEAVGGLAQSLRTNADEQEQASSGGSGGSGGSTGSGGSVGSGVGGGGGGGWGPSGSGSTAHDRPEPILPPSAAFLADRLLDIGEHVAPTPGQVLNMARFSGFFSGAVGTMEFIHDPTMETGFGAVGGLVGGMVGGTAGAAVGGAIAGPPGAVAGALIGSAAVGAVGSWWLGETGKMMDGALEAIVTGEPGPAEKFFAGVFR